jgi:Contractile injection system tube protein
MERAAFLIERTGQRIGCLLNPNSLVLRRLAGISSRRSSGLPLAGSRLADDPLLFTGGGRTELTLDLLFDVSLAGSSIITEDVRQLTAPLWQMAENIAGRDGYGQLPLVRFVWGKSWNIPGVVAGVAERLEHFGEDGAPTRSWLRIRFVRVSEGTAEIVAAAPTPMASLPSVSPRVETSPRVGIGPRLEPGPAGEGLPTEIVAGGAEGGSSRLDDLAHRYFSSAAAWRLIALFNNIIDPLRLPIGKILRIPPSAGSGRSS